MASIVDGQQFGRFQIVSRLGRGGMASVYRAYEHRLDRTVALKVLPEELLNLPGFVERFEREARVIAKLEHPHVVPLYGSGIDEGHPWMALRLVRGGHLGDRMEDGGLAREAGLDYFAKIAEALDFAHSHGIVHRDLKPQNVLVGERGECYIADFGIASLLEGTTRLTQTGAALGTPQYMAPEQAKGEAVGPPADIYALGIMVYQWQTGLLPFDADTPYAVMFKHVSAPLPMDPLAHLSERGRQVIARALAKSPEDRWSSASDFVQELRASLSDPASAPATAALIPSAPAATPAFAAAPVRASTSTATNEPAPPQSIDHALSSVRGAAATSDHRPVRAKTIFAFAVIVLLVGGGWGLAEWRPDLLSNVTTFFDGASQEIMPIQRDLNALGFRVAENGVADARTVEAIKSFERQHKLVVTGAPDRVLAGALKEELSRRDEAAWATAVKTDTEVAYRSYAQQSPQGK